MPQGYASLREFYDTWNAGQYRYTSWRKIPSQTTVAATWFDLSMSPGNPIPNYYASAPYVAATLEGPQGLFYGYNVAPARRFLKSISAGCTTAAPLPMRMILCDYLLYYPFIDMGTNDPQPMTNTVTLPRYTSGAGVQVMAVQTNPQVTGGSSFQFTYTNQAGVSNRLSQIQTCNTTTFIGSLINTQASATNSGQHFCGLQAGDSGVRSIESFQMTSGTDVGLIALVLVRPIADITIRETTAIAEADYFYDYAKYPEVQDGAYLNFICLPNGSLAAAPIIGDAWFTWS